ncbi:MAG: hypothetical protein K2Y40_18470 [Reyranella sp.]|nr:hypothetical protein [Reyranella sp.]
MSLSSTTNKVIYSGNGATSVWPFSFPVFEAADLVVILTDAAGLETTLSASLYGVSGIGNPAGGSVTYPLSGSPIATGTKLTLLRTVPYTQTTVLSNQGGYYPEVVERRFDQIYMALQQLEERLSRASLYSLSNPATEQSNLAPIQQLQPMNLLTQQGDVLTRDASAYKRLARGSAGQFLGIAGTDLAWATPPYPVFSAVRQTVLGGPVDSAGLPAFLPATAAGLAVTAQNVSATFPLVVAAAGGFGPLGPADRIGCAATAPVWSGLADNATNILYVEIGSTGAITTGSTTLEPVYQPGGAYGTAAGQHTFNIVEMTMKVGNGSTAAQVWRVFVGEAVTSGGSVTATRGYAYSGRYDSGFTATLPAGNAAVSKNHNVGVTPQTADFRIECTASEGGYSVGDQAGMGSLSGYNGAVQMPQSLSVSRNTINISVPSAPWYLFNKITSVSTLLTVANWRYKFVVDRGW